MRIPEGLKEPAFYSAGSINPPEAACACEKSQCQCSHRASGNVVQAHDCTI